MRIRLHATLAAAFAAASIAAPSVAHAQPATARPAPAAGADCPSGWLCGFTDAGYGGVGSFARTDMASYPETTAYVGFNDGLSVWNGSSRCVTVYNAVNYRGSSKVIRPGKGIDRLPASFGHVRSNRFRECGTR